MLLGTCSRAVVCCVFCSHSPDLRHPAAVVAWHLAVCLGCCGQRASLACVVAPRGAPRLIRSGRSRWSSRLSRRRGAFPHPRNLRPWLYWVAARGTRRAAGNRAHCACRWPPPRRGRWAREKKKKKKKEPATQPEREGMGGQGPQDRDRDTQKKKAQKTHPDNPAKKGLAQPRPAPSTHAHTARQNRKRRGASGAPTQPHTTQKQAETEPQPRTPQTADKRGTTPQTVPKHAHPRPQPGLAGLTKPTPNREPDANTNAAQH